MSAVELFTFPETGQRIRTVVIDGEPWVVAADAAGALGYGGGARNAVSRLPERMRGVASVNTPGGQQQMTVINEPGVYRLAMRSNVPSAERFQDWLAEEVVPSIRKTGGYGAVAPAPQRELTKLEVLEMAIESERRALAAESKVAELAPAAAAWDHLASGDGDWSVGDAAKILARDPAIRIGQGRLFKQLFEWGWTFRGGDSAWRVKQPQIECGRLSEIPQSHYHPRTGELVLDPPQVRIKPKGLVEIHKRLGGTAPLALHQQLELRGNP